MIQAINLYNLGTVNKNKVTIEKDDGRTVNLYFSYETIIGIVHNGERFISENDWSVTTGKLLNELEPDKSKRVPHARVMEEVAKALASL